MVHSSYALKYRSDNLIIFYYCTYSGWLNTVESSFIFYEIDEECRVFGPQIDGNWKWSVICTGKVWMLEGI